MKYFHLNLFWYFTWMRFDFGMKNNKYCIFFRALVYRLSYLLNSLVGIWIWEVGGMGWYSSSF